MFYETVLLQDITRGVLQFLEKHDVVSGIYPETRSPCSKESIDRWEQKNHPCQLPDDFRSFLSVANGVFVHWSAKLSSNSSPIPLGLININRLMDITEIPTQPNNSLGLPKSQSLRIFNLDSKSSCGSVGLVYNLVKPQSPQIWFRDLSGTWHFLADSFTKYFRLIQVHLGIQGWQYIFTPHGPDPIIQQWMSLFIPDRLEMDLKWLNSKENTKDEFEFYFKFENETNENLMVNLPRPSRKYPVLSTDKIDNALKKSQKSSNNTNNSKTNTPTRRRKYSNSNRGSTRLSSRSRK